MPRSSCSPAPVYRGELVGDEASDVLDSEVKDLKTRFKGIGLRTWVSAFESSGYNPVQELINTAMDPETSPLIKANIDLRLAGMLLPKIEESNKSVGPIVNVVVQSVSRVDLG